MKCEEDVFFEAEVSSLKEIWFDFFKAKSLKIYHFYLTFLFFNLSAVSYISTLLPISASSDTIFRQFYLTNS
jgi:hypothetical protein